MVFLSVDGGATKTIAIIYDIKGKILGTGLSSSSNYRNIGVEHARSSISRALGESLERSGYKIEDIEYSTFALAGVKDSNKSTQIIDEFISSYKLRGKYELLNDGEAGFRCRFPHGDGIIAAPGTGMISYGKKGGTMERCSGWGWFIGDEGGAFYIGRRAIQEAAKTADGRTDNQGLLKMILDKFNVKEPRMLVNEIYGEKIDVRNIASIASLVSKLANNGDIISKKLLEESSKEAALCVKGLIRKMKFNDVRVSGYGGVFRSGEIYWNTFKNEILQEFPTTKFKNPLLGYHAVLGSMQIVLEKMGVQIGEEEVETLSQELTSLVMKLPKEELKDFLMV